MQKYLVEIFSGRTKVHELSVYAGDKAGAMVVMARHHGKIINDVKNLQLRISVL